MCFVYSRHCNTGEAAQRFALPALCLDKLDNQGGDGEAVQPEK